MASRTVRPDPDRLAQAALIAAVLAQLPATALAASGRVGAGSVEELSNSFDVAVTPANPAFGIWGPIYAGSLAMAGYQALPGKRTDPLLRSVRLPAAAAYAGNAVWLLAFPSQRYRLALACILTTLAGSTLAYARTTGADRHVGAARVDGGDRPLSPAQARLVRAPLGLLAGWITVAAPSAVAITLLDAGHDRISSRTASRTASRAASRAGRRAGPKGAGWAPPLLAALAAITAGVTRRVPGSLSYPAAVTWGLAGVAANNRVPTSARTAAALAATVTTAAAGHTWQPRRESSWR
jgi:hypothetical protein